ncbi:MAG: Holliday junction branch migration protein RuvA [Bacilli bacterium]|nr:Holliday junction branch migration protein RuvA [Bacilli bacterium]
MYEYIKGTVSAIESNYIVLETNGVGYLIYTPNPYSFQENNEYKVYLYQQVREDMISLYGFKERDERDLFLKLIEVKGLGCKTALPMLATGSITGIMDAIERENILYLKKFPKIGDKVARQIILDLKGKLVPNANTKGTYQHFEELIEVLKGLGYKTNDINKILPSIDLNKTIEEQIKYALKLMLK